MEDLAEIRSFNRAVTRHTGVLNDRYLGRGRPLGASRLLFEIGRSEGQEAELRELRNRLGLDSGYMSRLLASLEDEGLVRLATSGRDRRVRVAKVTSAGAREFEVLDRLSDKVARDMVLPLPEGKRRRLIEAMRTVRSLLDSTEVRYDQVDPAGTDARYCLDRFYADLAERFEEPFDAAAMRQAPPGSLSAPNGSFIVARLHGRPIGCCGVKFHEDHGEVKRLWVDPLARGMGVGRGLLAAVEGKIMERGLDMARLDTNRALLEARALYEATGYVEVPPFNDERYAHHWFEKRLEVPPSVSS